MKHPTDEIRELLLRFEFVCAADPAFMPIAPDSLSATAPNGREA